MLPGQRHLNFSVIATVLWSDCLPVVITMQLGGRRQELETTDSGPPRALTLTDTRHFAPSPQMWTKSSISHPLYESSNLRSVFLKSFEFVQANDWGKNAFDKIEGKQDQGSSKAFCSEAVQKATTSFSRETNILFRQADRHRQTCTHRHREREWEREKERKNAHARKREENKNTRLGRFTWKVCLYVFTCLKPCFQCCRIQVKTQSSKHNVCSLYVPVRQALARLVWLVFYK